MPNLPDCVNSLFEPGAIQTSTGTDPVTPVLPTLTGTDTTDYTDKVQYSLDFSKFYNSFYIGVM